MTFEEAYELLNTDKFADVAEQMVSWHPSILGEMLRAVAVAKRRRYPLLHPDYDIGVQAVLRSVDLANSERLAELDEKDAD